MVGKNNQTKQAIKIDFEVFENEKTYQSPKNISEKTKRLIRNRNLGRYAVIFRTYDKLAA